MPFCLIFMKPADLDLRCFFSPQEHLIVPTGHLLGIDRIWLMWFRPPDKSVHGKNIFFISHPKHMLWVLKRTVSMSISMRRFF